MPTIQHNSNFRFLAEHDERLAKIGYEAEQLASISPTACMMQVRLLAELLAKETAAYLGVYVGDGPSFYQVLSRLEDDRAFRHEIKDLSRRRKGGQRGQRARSSRKAPPRRG